MDVEVKTNSNKKLNEASDNIEISSEEEGVELSPGDAFAWDCIEVIYWANRADLIAVGAHYWASLNK